MTKHVQHEDNFLLKQDKLDGSHLHLDSAGTKVGIGTDSPDYHLHLKDSGDPSFKIERASDNYVMLNETHFLITKPTNAQFDFNLQGHTNDMVFKTNNIERLRLKANGFTGIGTNAPAYHLHIKDSGDPSVKIERASNNYVMINETHYMMVKASGSQYDFNLQGLSDMVFKTNNLERMRLKSNGIINFPGLPTSGSGLVSGDLWRDSSTNQLRIVP